MLQAWEHDSPSPTLSVLVVPFLAGFAPRLLAAAARGMAQRLWLGAELPARTAPLTQIRGVDNAITDRLNEEGISDVYTLMADPVRLLRNAPYDVRQVVAWIDESAAHDVPAQTLVKPRRELDQRGN